METSAHELRKAEQDRWQQICDRICDGLDDLDLQVNRDYWFHELKGGHHRVLLELSNVDLLTPKLLVACAKATPDEKDDWDVIVAYIDRQADKLVGLAATRGGFVSQTSNQRWVLQAVREANIRVSGIPLPRIG
jgi:hypothetical protein